MSVAGWHRPLDNPLYRITQLRWETGPVIPQELQQSLSAREMELFNTYDRILTNFTQVGNVCLLSSRVCVDHAL